MLLGVVSFCKSDGYSGRPAIWDGQQAVLPLPDKGRLADHPHKAAAHAIPPSRRSDTNLNFRLSRWTDALRLFVVVYCVSRFVNIILRNEAVLFVTTP
jgi:hypothetical protein